MAYGMMTASQIKSTVRSIVDLDTDDLPDAVLDLYIRDGYYRILDIEKRWSFLEYSFEFSTQPNVRSYDIATIAAEPLSQVISIVDNTGTGTRLVMIGFDEAERTYSGVYDDFTGNPEFYAIWGNQVHIYPRPNNARVLTCRGYREPIDWQSEGGDVDAIPSLHFPLVYYACSRIYQQLEDAAMSDMYKRAFDEGLALAAKNATTPNSHSPMVLAGNRSGHKSMSGWLQSLGRQQWG